MHMISVHAFRPEMRSRTCRNLARLGVDWLDFKAGKPPLRRAQLIDIGWKAQRLRLPYPKAQESSIRLVPYDT